MKADIAEIKQRLTQMEDKKKQQKIYHAKVDKQIQAMDDAYAKTLKIFFFFFCVIAITFVTVNLVGSVLVQFFS